MYQRADSDIRTLADPAGRRVSVQASTKPEVPIFAMTANAFPDDTRRSRTAGMNEHLTKPLDAKELLAAIARYRKQKENP